MGGARRGMAEMTVWHLVFRPEKIHFNFGEQEVVGFTKKRGDANGDVDHHGGMRGLCCEKLVCVGGREGRKALV